MVRYHGIAQPSLPRTLFEVCHGSGGSGAIQETHLPFPLSPQEELIETA